MLQRQEIIDALKKSLPEHDCLRAAWLGGSDAALPGRAPRADSLSDVDVFLIARRDDIEGAFEAFRACLRAISPIRLELRLPMATWHGFHQTFVQLEDASDELMVDMLAIEEGRSHPWLEVERHGTPIVLFDKDGAIRSTHADRATLRTDARASIERARVRFALFHHLPIKLAKRNLPVDAFAFYHSMVLRPLVDVLRGVHCPDRHDYGFRYVKDDLPAEAYAALVRLAYPKSLEEIPAFVAEAKTLLLSEIAEQILDA